MTPSFFIRVTTLLGRAIDQAVSRGLSTAEVQGSIPG
jgi:hypothetical protein